MMRSSLFACFFLLFVALYFFSEDIIGHPGLPSSVSTVLGEDGRSQRDVKSPSSPHRKFKDYYRSKVLVETEKGLNSLEGTWKPEFSSRSRIASLDGFIYHTDYHGVTTHPTPTPKHPKP